MAGSTLKPTELEEKILACYGKMKVPTISRMLGIKKSKVYGTYRKYDMYMSDLKGVRKLLGPKIPKKRAKNEKRITKPFKTTQLG